MNFREASNLKEMVRVAEELAGRFSSRAGELDEIGSFPYQNFQELKDSGYTSLTVPKEFGGGGISLLDMIILQEKIAAGDGSTALAIGWHMGIMKNLAEKRPWNEAVYKEISESAVKNGSLINSASSEKATGSPTRGGRPQTFAKRRDGHWEITGRKIFTTLAPVLDYALVSASLEGREEIGTFLLQMDTPGISIEETWDSISMRGTGSHDLVLEKVIASEEQMVETSAQRKLTANGWLLHIPACYLGIASAAKNYAISFAKSYSPNSISSTISELPSVRQKIGQMELLYLESRSFLHSTARSWDESGWEEREAMQPVLNAVKAAVVNKAQEIVDLAMRLAGASSLSRKSPLQRYYRDVRAGLHNPPMDDMTIELLAKTALSRF